MNLSSLALVVKVGFANYVASVLHCSIKKGFILMLYKVVLNFYSAAEGLRTTSYYIRLKSGTMLFGA